MGASAQKIPAWQKIDFIGRRKVWFAISGTVVLVGLVSLGVRGLNLGIDFEGGSQVDLRDADGRTPSRRSEARRLSIAGADAVIQGRGDGRRTAPTASSRSRRSRSRAAEQTELARRSSASSTPTSVGVKNVSASFSRADPAERAHRDRRLAAPDRRSTSRSGSSSSSRCRCSSRSSTTSSSPSGSTR